MNNRLARPRISPARITGTAWMLVVGVAGCTSDRDMTGPSEPVDNSGLVVSSLSSPSPSSLSAGTVAAAVATTVAYVSLVSGTVETGVRADVLNRGTGLATSVPMQEGGFDPVAVPAEEGDDIEVTVHEADGGTRRFTSTVSLFRLPVVVRTGPSRGATDVPLNSLIIIIFSEPMDPETVEETGMRLVGPGGLVPLTVDLGADGLTAVATPTEPLDVASTYTLVVESTATSAQGLDLGEAYRSDFTTIELPVSFVLEFGPVADTAQAGTKVQLSIAIWESPNKKIEGLPVQWFSLDPSIARVDSTGLVHGIGVGVVQVAATIGGLGPVPMTLTFTPLVFSSVSSGGAHTCGIATEGTAFCWGSNTSGQLGTGDTEPSSIPAPVAGDLRFKAIAAGAEHTCAVAMDGAVYCWGSDESWQLGRRDRQEPGTPGQRRTPTLLPHGLLAGTTAGGEHTCARDPAGAALCWGAYRYGEQTLYLDGPQAVEGASIIESVASGGHHTCGISSGAGFCWGRNDRGQLGDGTVVSRPSLVGAVDTLSRPALGPRIDGFTFAALSAGLAHTCGLVGDQAYCWGDAGDGRLGLGSLFSAPFVTTPTALAGGVGFSSLALGGRHTCGIAAGGSPYCWGSNAFGQLGDGTRDDRPVPSPVADGLRFDTLVAGTDHACGLASDGLLYCWGRSVAGEVGTGFTGVHDRPAEVALQR
jgi:alpha-tubulin suppressor-like RCC1 family protein